MTSDDIKAFRESLGVTQATMATAMGMPLRSYQDIEGGKNPVRPVHVAAAKWANVKLASTGETQLDGDVREMVKHALAHSPGS
ncbi:UNVERIFIED_ORG: transcriptional regulator with XRE-family HTH domain [Agrobacterium larrymoorei]|nr:transcriptional regulator with XRE-family HTH domain [Agrobacterium larrymoorei]